MSDPQTEAAAVPMDGDAFLSLLARRRSTRVFRDEPVPTELLERIVRAATMTPTACNRQLWHFVVITDPAVKREACRLSDAQQSYFHDAPALIAVFYDGSLEKRNPCHTSHVSAGMAIAALLFAAEAHGLGAIYIGGIRRPDGVRRAVKAPPFLQNFGVVCVGYRDDDPPAPLRRPVDEVMEFNGCFRHRPRFFPDIRPHLWKLPQLADFRDRLLWYKGVHIDGRTLHVDSDARFSPKFRFMTDRLGTWAAAVRAPRILDVLSFNGDVAFQMLLATDDPAATVFAYDLTPGIARFIGERFRRALPDPRLRCLVNEGADVLRIPLPDAHAHVLSCYERLEHFHDPMPLLREMHRVLAPGGRALVVVSNRFYPHLYRYRRMRRRDYALGRNWNRGPERKYEPAEIERHLREAGFRITGSAGLQPATMKLSGLAERLLRRAGRHAAADGLADRRASGYATRGWDRIVSASIAYELTRD